MSRKEISTDDIKLDEPKIDLDKGADALEQLEVPVAHDLHKLAAEESFMNDKLELFLAEPANESESPFAEVTVNGKYFCFRRGASSIAPRYAVAVLARSKTVRVSTEKRVMADGSEQSVPVTRTSSCYPFSVISDPAGAKGSAWLKNLLSQPA